MQKILFLADLHGNMPATLALEKEIDKIKPDDVWFLGDAVGTAGILFRETGISVVLKATDQAGKTITVSM